MESTLVLTALVLLHWIADAANSSSIVPAITTNASVGETVDAYKSIFFSVIEIVAALLFIVLLLKLFFWARRDEGLLILPFEVAKSEDKSDFCGKAISDLLVAEIQRIEQINDPIVKYVGIETEKVMMPSAAPTVEGANVPQLGTIAAGSTSISIGELLTTIKRLGSINPEIACCLQKYGPVISLTACLTKPLRKPQISPLPNTSAHEIDLPRGHVWEVHEQINYERIPELVRDLSFKIVYDLSKKSISAKNWLAFRHYTEALDSYGQYARRGEKDIKYLDSARENCIQAINVEQDYKKLFHLLENLGLAYYDQEMWDKAEEMFSKAIEIRFLTNQKYSEAWYNKGVALDKQGKYKEAIQAFEKALDFNPNCVDSQTNIGSALNSLGKYEKAIEACDKAIKIGTQLLVNLATDSDEMGKGGKAIEIRNHLLAAWANKGSALYKLGKYKDSINALDKATEIDPQFAEAWYNKGVAFYSQKEYDEAITAYDKAIEITPEYALAWYNKGLSLKALGRTTESDAAFAKAKELGYTSPT